MERHCYVRHTIYNQDMAIKEAGMAGKILIYRPIYAPYYCDLNLHSVQINSN